MATLQQRLTEIYLAQNRKTILVVRHQGKPKRAKLTHDSLIIGEPLSEAHYNKIQREMDLTEYLNYGNMTLELLLYKEIEK